MKNKPRLPRKAKKAFKKTFYYLDPNLAMIWKSNVFGMNGYRAYLTSCTGYHYKIQKGKFIRLPINDVLGLYK